MTLFTVAYLVCALVGMAALLYKAAELRRRWGSPCLYALCAALFLVTVTFWFAAPSTIGFVNRVTGIPNVSAPIVYCLVVAFAAATLAYALFWRYPDGGAGPTVRLILAGYAAAIVAMVALFAASDVPTERRTDFDTYYADQPTVAAFLLVYLGSTLAGAVYLIRQLTAWSGTSTAPLRLFATAILFPVVFDVVKIVAVVAVWFDVHAFDAASTAAPLLNVVAVFVVAAGVLRRRRRAA